MVQKEQTGRKDRQEQTKMEVGRKGENRKEEMAHTALCVCERQQLNALTLHWTKT